MRHLRAVFRLIRVGLHLGYGTLVVAGVYPWASRSVCVYLKRRWSRQLLAMLGVRLQVVGDAAGAVGLRVANHISWLDIFVINAIEPVAFVAKDDVRGWPLIGWLSEKADTVFIARDSRRSAHAVGQCIAAMLSSGMPVAVFPEGTTSAGDTVLPFRGALLQGAIDAGVAIQPHVLRYAATAGRRSQAPAYCGDTTLLASLWRIAAAPTLTAICLRLAPLAVATADRRSLAAACEARVRAALCPAISP